MLAVIQAVRNLNVWFVCGGEYSGFICSKTLLDMMQLKGNANCVVTIDKREKMIFFEQHSTPYSNTIIKFN